MKLINCMKSFEVIAPPLRPNAHHKLEKNMENKFVFCNTTCWVYFDEDYRSYYNYSFGNITCIF